MWTITIKDVPENIISNFYKTIFSYDEVTFLPKKYIDSKEYIEEDFEVFSNMEDLVRDLQKYKK